MRGVHVYCWGAGGISETETDEGEPEEGSPGSGRCCYGGWGGQQGGEEAEKVYVYALAVVISGLYKSVFIAQIPTLSVIPRPPSPIRLYISKEGEGGREQKRIPSPSGGPYASPSCPEGGTKQPWLLSNPRRAGPTPPYYIRAARAGGKNTADSHLPIAATATTTATAALHRVCCIFCLAWSDGRRKDGWMD